MNDDSLEISIKEKRKFFLSLFLLPFAPGVILFKFGQLDIALQVLGVFWFLLVLSFISPTFCDFFYRFSKKITKFLGNNIAKLVLFLVYVICVLPVGLLMKIVRRDRLKLKKSNKATYWEDVKEVEPSYEYQF